MRFLTPGRYQSSLLLLLLVAVGSVIATWLFSERELQTNGAHSGRDVGRASGWESTSPILGIDVAEGRRAVERQPEYSDSAITETCSISGQVSDWQEDPITRFQIIAVHGGESQRSVLQWFSSLAGEFTLEGLTLGAWTIYAKADEQRLSERVGIQVPHIGTVQLTCAASARISGIVMHPSGVPLEGATVSFGTIATTSKGGGHFLLDKIAPGGGEIMGRFEDLITPTPIVVNTFRGVHLQGVELNLGYSGRLTGIVLDSEGLPESAVDVEVARVGYSALPPIRTNVEGEFELRTLAPGLYLARVAETPEQESERRAAAEVFAGERAHIVLQGSTSSAVTVFGLLTLGTEPMAGEMAIFPDGGSAAQGAYSARITEDGRFEVHLSSAGRFVFMARTATGRISPFHVAIPDGASHDLHLEISEGRIAGLLNSEDGSPAVDCEVVLEMAGQHNLLSTGPIMRGGPNSQHLYKIKTDNEGRWSFDGLAAGQYVVLGRGVGWSQLPLVPSAYFGGIHIGEGEQTDNIVLTLRQGGMVGCSVVDRAGSPVNDAAIFVRDAHGEWVNPVSVESTFMDGTTVVTDLPPGLYTFMARTRDGVTRESVPVEVPGALDRLLHNDKWPTIDLELLPGAGLTAKLLDSVGRPVHAVFAVHDAQGRVQSGTTCFHDRARLIENGSCSDQVRLSPLLPGSYEVTATTAQGRRVTAKVVLQSGIHMVLVLKLGS